MNFRISGIDILTFLLTRSRVLHLRSFEIAKRKIYLEERFDISEFQDLGSRGDSDLELRVSNSRGKENHSDTSGFGVPEVSLDRRSREKFQSVEKEDY
jgi:hypothetical protein